MDSQSNILKEQLQLIGVTCLFIASKIEVSIITISCFHPALCFLKIIFQYLINNCLLFSQEIYPPKLADFAYVTDGACTTDEIVFTELVICKVSGRVHIYSHGINSLTIKLL